MRFWFSGPRIFGMPTGMSVSPRDFIGKGTSAKDADCAFVYVMQSAGRIKIGVSADPRSRLAQLQTGSSERIVLAYSVGTRASYEAYEIEKAAHGVLASRALQGEWFDATVDQGISALAVASQRTEMPIVAVKPENIQQVIDYVVASTKPRASFWKRLFAVPAAMTANAMAVALIWPNFDLFSKQGLMVILAHTAVGGVAFIWALKA